MLSLTVPAGFPSPAADYMEEQIDLNKELITNKPATFLIKVTGNSMQDARIYDGDILVIDRSLTAKHNDIIVAVVDGGFTVKRLKKRRQQLWLVPENIEFPAITITPEMDFEVWGVVTYTIHPTK